MFLPILQIRSSSSGAATVCVCFFVFFLKNLVRALCQPKVGSSHRNLFSHYDSWMYHSDLDMIFWLQVLPTVGHFQTNILLKCRTQPLNFCSLSNTRQSWSISLKKKNIPQTEKSSPSKGWWKYSAKLHKHKTIMMLRSIIVGVLFMGIFEEFKGE